MSEQMHNHSVGTVTTVLFTRHGKVFNPNHVVYERLPHFPLSNLGHNQAITTGKWIANSEYANFSAAYSSPLLRTQQTARHILEQNQQYSGQLITDNRIIEAGNSFRGTPHKKILTDPRNWARLYNPVTPSWGEPYVDIASRMHNFLNEKVQQHRGETILVVSHESPIWCLRLDLLGKSPRHNPSRRHVGLASITAIQINAATNKLISIRYIDPNTGEDTPVFAQES